MASVNDILARSRVIATQMGLDANQSPLVDNRGGFRALLNTALSNIIIKRARDKKNWRDVAIRHTISMTAGVGDLPSGVLREYMHTADFQNDDRDLISYLNFDLDNNELFDTYLGYAKLAGDTVEYTAPNTDFGDYTGKLYLTVPSVPEIPTDPTDNIAMTDEIFNDVCSSLALMVRAEMPIT